MIVCYPIYRRIFSRLTPHFVESIKIQVNQKLDQIILFTVSNIIFKYSLIFRCSIYLMLYCIF